LPAYGTTRFYDFRGALSWLAAGSNRVTLATYDYQVARCSPLITARATQRVRG
jgi:hypothetical protein